MPNGLRYNEVQQKSVHNAFQRHEGLSDQFFYWRIRSMEVDIHDTDVFGETIKGDWALYHGWHDPMSTVARLSQFLRTCVGLHEMVPDHEVVTLFIDIKDPLASTSTANHSWKTLDGLLDTHLGPMLYRPDDVRQRAPGAEGLRSALSVAGWPTLAELRGKFIVVLTGSNDQLGNYAKSDRLALTRSAFLSKPVDGASDVPGGGDTVFFNVNGENNMKLVSRVTSLGFVSRAYYVNTRDLWDAAEAEGCHHIATDYVNDRLDRWASTRNSSGYPFAQLDGRRSTEVERGQTWGIWARSDDMWDKRDSFFFTYRQYPIPAADNTFEFAISGANSHLEDWVKGAVIARAGLAADDAYFAVVRTGQKHGLRVQFRPAKGSPTTTTTPTIGPSGLFGDDIDQDTIVHVRLRLSGGATAAMAWGSYDRKTWTLLGRFNFPSTPLQYQGLGVSSHGQRRGVKFLFVPGPDSPIPEFTSTAMVGGGDGHTGWVDRDGRGRWLSSEWSRHRPAAAGTGGATDG